MRTIQMTIDEPLLNEVDQTIQELHTTRSEFIREALKLALRRYHIAKLEQQHEEGYRATPADANDDVVEWEDVQHWGAE
ncbi:MAG: ribbon-helix-helix protein, CopG family [Ardenticatenales bacterium]|nr:ribbon-helix-helix protein, CopG family [Ardenticatenales bacterium]